MKNLEKLLLIFLIGLSSCLVMINENDYRGLSRNDLNNIKSFDLYNLIRQVSYVDSFYVYEINISNIKECARNSGFLWVHLWRPGCKANYCQNINYFSALADQYRTDVLNMLFVSESYDIKQIKGAVNRNCFDKPIYVLQDSYFGHKIKDARKKFSEINNGLIQEVDFLTYDDYIFKDSLLIFACKEIHKTELDSIISVNMK